MLCISFVCFALLSFSQDAYLDSLKNTLSTRLHDTTRMQVLQILVENTGPGEWESYNQQLMDFAERKLTEKKLPAALAKKTREYLAGTYHNKGISYLEKTEQDNALVWFTKTLDLAQKHQLTDFMGSANYEIGNIYYRKGDFKKSSLYIYKALKIFETIGNRQGMADALTSIGNLYHQAQTQQDKALDYYQQSLRIQEEIKDSMGMSLSLRCIAIVWQEQRDFQKASIYYKRALQILQKSGDARQMANTMNNLGRLMQRMGQLDSSLYYFRQAFEQWEQLGDKEGVCMSMYDIGYIYFRKKQYDTALPFAQKSLAISKEIGYPALNAKTYHLLYFIFKAKKQYAPALEMHEKYTVIIDSLENSDNHKALMEQKLQYNFEKKEILSKAKTEKELDRIKIDNERKASRKNIWIIVLISFLCLVVVSGYFLYKQLRQRNIIADQKSHILKQRLLVSQMNPHFVFNSLNAIQNYIFKQDSLQAGTYLAQFADLMRMILEFSRRDFITIAEETNMLTNYLDLQQLRFEKKFSYSIEVDDSIDPENILIPPMLAQPFIENAIEHGIFYKQEKSHIAVRIKFKDQELTYEIEDDGVGLEKAAEQGKKTGKKTNSLATVIAKERMEVYNKQGGKKMYIAVEDKVKTNPATSGIKVSFNVPYGENI